jgi:hypothetical protein
VRRPPSSRITASARLPTMKLSSRLSNSMPAGPSSPASMPTTRNTSRNGTPRRDDHAPSTRPTSATSAPTSNHLLVSSMNTDGSLIGNRSARDDGPWYRARPQRIVDTRRSSAARCPADAEWQQASRGVCHGLRKDRWRLSRAQLSCAPHRPVHGRCSPKCNELSLLLRSSPLGDLPTIPRVIQGTPATAGAMHKHNGCSPGLPLQSPAAIQVGN